MNDIDQTGDIVTDFRRTITSAEQTYPGTTYYPDWSKWFGIYKAIPDIHAVVDNLASWTVGRGYEAETKVKELLDKIRGCGIDSFNGIMKNQLRTALIGGDSFAEIIKNKRGVLRNLKPISPASMKIESSGKGMITKYVQVTYYIDNSGTRKRHEVKFNPESIFHLSWNRLGDEPHGRSMIEPLEDVIEMKNEAMTDMRIVFHRYVKPLILSKVDTDDPTEIEKFKKEIDKAIRYMENMIVPKGAVEMERMSIPQYSTLDPLPWLRALQSYFVSGSGVPEVILGFGRETTEASAKILYLAFQQTIEDIQLMLEEQIKAQLNLDVEFNFPENIGPELAMDIQKERNMNNFNDDGKGTGLRAISPANKSGK